MVELGFQYPSKLGGSRGMGVDKNHPAMKFHAPIPGWYLPAALFWRIQSKGFWDTTPPDGRNGFLLPRLFCIERQMDEAAPKLRFKDISISSYAGEDNPFQDMMRRWNERVALWSARRPWYELAAREWEKVCKERSIAVSTHSGVYMNVPHRKLTLQSRRHGAISSYVWRPRSSLQRIKNEMRLHAQTQRKV